MELEVGTVIRKRNPLWMVPRVAATEFAATPQGDREARWLPFLRSPEEPHDQRGRLPTRASRLVSDPGQQGYATTRGVRGKLRQLELPAGLFSASVATQLVSRSAEKISLSKNVRGLWPLKREDLDRNVRFNRIVVARHVAKNARNRCRRDRFLSPPESSS